MAPLMTIDAPRWRPLLEAGPDGRIGAGRSVGTLAGRTGDATAWILIEEGNGALVAGDQTADVAGRRDVFEGPGWSALVGPHTSFSIEGSLSATVVWRASDRAISPVIIDPAGVADEARGEGATARRVRTYLAEGPMIVGETLNPPGGWSSWPPHRHRHEELYLYRFAPAHGFGVHVAFDDAAGPTSVDTPVIVRDGHAERITDGWHPVVAAPGCEMYYLWALVGDSDTVDTKVHPSFES